MWKKYWKTILPAAILLLAGAVYWFFAPEQESVPGETAPETGGVYGWGLEEPAETDRTEEEPADPETSALIYVYLCGAVENPAVYGLSEGCRLYEAVEKAGGFREDAATEAVNLASVLEDGQLVRIPTREEAEAGITVPAGAETEAGSGLVNLNRASMEELMTLPGIGETRAQAILDYRNTHGGFQSTEEIMNVSGIKEASFEKIKDRITV